MTIPPLTATQLAARTAAAAVVTGGLLAALPAVDRWVGDWGALFWMASTLFFPWLAGIAAGTRLSVNVARAAGAVFGGAIVLAPLAAFANLPSDDTAVIAVAFTGVGMVCGAMALPVGIRLRSAGKR